MSLILDALKKSETERSDRPAARSRSEPINDEEENGVPRRAIVLGLLVLVAIGSLSVILFLQRDLAPTDILAENQRSEPVNTVNPSPTEQLRPEKIIVPKPDETLAVTKAPQEEPPQPETPMEEKVSKPVSPSPATPVAEKPALPAVSEPEQILVKPQPEAPISPEPTPSIKEQPTPTEIAEPPVHTPVTAAPEPAALAKVTSRFSPPTKPTAPPQPPAPVNADLAKQSVRQAEKYEQVGQIDLAIESYGRAIGQDNQNAEAYFARGWLHEANRAYETAISDFSSAIGLNVNFTDAYFARAWAYEQSGDVAAAITDYSNVVRLEPGHMNATLSRGILRFYGDLKTQSEADFQNVYGKAEAELSDYGLLWLFVSRIQGSANPTLVASELSSIQPRTEWPGVLFRSFIGDASTTQVMAAMQTSDPLVSRKRQCVGYFFLAQHRLALGDQAGAREYFAKTLESGITSYRQYWAAKIELKRLTGTQ